VSDENKSPLSRAFSLIESAHSPLDVPLDEFLGQVVKYYRQRAEAEAAEAPPSIVQDYTPLVDSLESKLAEIYWKTVGVQAFAGNEVPFLITNDGRLSEDAATVFLANCLESRAPESRIRVLELGSGTGLFARYFLDAFKEICHGAGHDFYDRLTYYVSDGSRRTVEQWHDSEQFAAHGDHALLGTCDACDPHVLTPLDGTPVPIDGLRGVFANYVLDVLPAAVVRFVDERTEHLCVRTLIEGEQELLRAYTELDRAAIESLARADDPVELAKLLPIINFMKFETGFVPVADDALPHAEAARAFGKGLPRVLFNFGAITCLHACLDRLLADGFILINDYGPSKEEEVANFGTATRFGSSIAMGLNFPLIEHCFSQTAEVLAPPNDEKRTIHSRTLAKKTLEGTRTAYLTAFGSDRWYWELETSAIGKARKKAMTGLAAEATEHYRHALNECPNNWCVLGEVAEFLIRNGQPGEGTYLAALALRRNPWYSPWLWNTLGDGLWGIDRYVEAQNAYLEATRVNPTDVTANFNVSFTYARAGRYREALDALSRALAHDFSGEFRGRIMEQQTQIMRSLSASWVTQQVRRTQRAAAFE
jgi:tetratricopeptide (TPR) repeat protein